MNIDNLKQINKLTAQILTGMVALIFGLLIAVIVLAIKLNNTDPIVIERTPYYTIPDVKIERYKANASFRELWSLNIAQLLGNLNPLAAKRIRDQLKYSSNYEVYLKINEFIDSKIDEMKKTGLIMSFTVAGKPIHDIKNSSVTVQGYMELRDIQTNKSNKWPYIFKFNIEAYDYGPYVVGFDYGQVEKLARAK